jgi:hypothetical protein
MLANQDPAHAGAVKRGASQALACDQPLRCLYTAFSVFVHEFWKIVSILGGVLEHAGSAGLTENITEVLIIERMQSMFAGCFFCYRHQIDSRNRQPYDAM